MRNTWVSLTNKTLLTIGVLSLLLLSSPLNAQDGEAVFKANCTACHKIDKKLIGPALQGAHEKWVSRTGDSKALVSWVQNSQGYIKSSGDSYAKDLVAEFNNSMMPPMALSEAEILAVFDYIDNSQAKAKADAPAATTDGGGTGAMSGGEVTEQSSDPTVWLIVLALVLFISFRVLWGVSKNLESLNNQKDGVEIKEEKDFLTSIVNVFRKNRAVSTIAIVLVLAYLAVLGWDALMGIGVYQAYQPKQPIWFSHKIHAGQNGINCVYCHNSAEKGKVAGIPTLNICMNCHKGVQEGKVTGTKEISKIYDAIGWDPNKLQYIADYEQKPIEWVRIHNLQDFVYFNHSQHVVVGKQQCQTCHGPIQEMDEVYQYAELTMGWCINCHRETDVSMEGNGYYEKIHAELVEKHKKEGLETFKVEHIGGLECGKCHY